MTNESNNVYTVGTLEDMNDGVEVGTRITTASPGTMMHNMSGTEILQTAKLDTAYGHSVVFGFDRDITLNTRWYTAARLREMTFKPINVTDAPAPAPAVTLLTIADRIEAEPHRYDQETWGDALLPDTSADDGAIRLAHAGYSHQRDTSVEACGTAFCIAGWVAVESGEATLEVKKDAYDETIQATWRNKDGVPVGVEHIPYIAKNLFEDVYDGRQGRTEISHNEFSQLFEAHWTPPEGMTPAAALRLIHHGQLKISDRYDDFTEGS